MYEDNKQAMKRMYTEVFMGGQMDVVDELITDDFREHEEFPGLTQDKEGVKKFVEMLRSAFPDLTVEAHEMVAENDMVVVRATFSGTFKGEFAGMPPTGKRFEVETYDMVRFNSEGKGVEHWGVTDNLKMMQQLGVIPEGP